MFLLSISKWFEDFIGNNESHLIAYVTYVEWLRRRGPFCKLECLATAGGKQESNDAWPRSWIKPKTQIKGKKECEDYASAHFLRISIGTDPICEAHILLFSMCALALMWMCSRNIPKINWQVDKYYCSTTNCVGTNRSSCHKTCQLRVLGSFLESSGARRWRVIVWQTFGPPQNLCVFH